MHEAIENGSNEDLDYFIADAKAQLDKMVPLLKRSAEWTLEDESRLKTINSEYKTLSHLT